MDGRESLRNAEGQEDDYSFTRLSASAELRGTAAQLALRMGAGAGRPLWHAALGL